MSTALRITHGAFGRVALLDMDRSLVRHAHPHCHVLIKADGADTQFAVGDNLVKLTDQQAVLVNTWEPHAYVHYKERPRTIILALYIEPEWLKSFRPNWAASGARYVFSKAGPPGSPRHPPRARGQRGHKHGRTGECRRASGGSPWTSRPSCWPIRAPAPSRSNCCPI